jgi:hypothetical protein
VLALEVGGGHVGDVGVVVDVDDTDQVPRDAHRWSEACRWRVYMLGSTTVVSQD